jgi:plastocyanin
VLIAAALSIGLLSACSAQADESSAVTSPRTSDNDVTVRTFMFDPSPLHVETGTTVTWADRDRIDHTVTSGTPKDPNGTFDGTLPHEGATFTFRFDKPGTYPYFCRIHNVMRGEIVVAA